MLSLSRESQGHIRSDARERYKRWIIYFVMNRRGNQKGQSRATDNIGYRRRRKTKQKHNTICVGHHYVQSNTNNVNKT
jgi:hypothetical protein